MVLFPHGTAMQCRQQHPATTSFIMVQVLDGGKAEIKAKREKNIEVTNLGWTKLYLFDNTNELCGGRWRLQLRDPPIMLETSSLRMRGLARAGRGEVCVRVVDAKLQAKHTRLDVLPQRKLYFPDGPIGCDIALVLAF